MRIGDRHRLRPVHRGALAQRRVTPAGELRDEHAPDVGDERRASLGLGHQVEQAPADGDRVRAQALFQREERLHRAARPAEQEDVVEIGDPQRRRDRHQVAHVVDVRAAELLDALAAVDAAILRGHHDEPFGGEAMEAMPWRHLAEVAVAAAREDDERQPLRSLILRAPHQAGDLQAVAAVDDPRTRHRLRHLDASLELLGCRVRHGRPHRDPFALRRGGLLGVELLRGRDRRLVGGCDVGRTGRLLQQGAVVAGRLRGRSARAGEEDREPEDDGNRLTHALDSTTGTVSSPGGTAARRDGSSHRGTTGGG